MMKKAGIDAVSEKSDSVECTVRGIRLMTNQAGADIEMAIWLLREGLLMLDNVPVSSRLNRKNKKVFRRSLADYEAALKAHSRAQRKLSTIS